MQRPSNRRPEQLRTIQANRHYTRHAEGSVLIQYGDTQVLCTASVCTGVPRFLKGSGQGWLTAEYGMLPRATRERNEREAVKGKQGGRTQEIQRLIGRSLRAAIDLTVLGENTITLDCDVLQADGGTRTAAITGSCIALIDALTWMQQKKIIARNPLRYLVAAVSVGIYQSEPVLDLDYQEDSQAHTDLNVVMHEQGGFIEIQGTAEAKPFTDAELQAMLGLAKKGIQELFLLQRNTLLITE